MGKLLHVSDFHITKDKKQSRERLQSLANYLNESQINIDILVFSGDLVDAKRIVDITRHSFIKEHLDLDLNKNDNKMFRKDLLKYGEIDSKYIKDYNLLLEQNTKEAFDVAIEIFKEFIGAIGISDTKRIIICCGNHDIIERLYLENSDIECDSINSNKKIISSFEYYNYFHKKIKNVEIYNTHLEEIDCFNFVIINTNFKDSHSKNSFCWNCFDIKNFIDNNHDVLQRKKHNILVAHQPFENVCENAEYDYSPKYEAAYQTVFSIMSNISNYLLCGDKHTFKSSYGLDWNILMSGSPLISKRLVYNLIEYDEGITGTKLLIWDNNKWKIYPIQQTIQFVYNLCMKFINKSSYKLFLNKEKKSYKDALITLKDVEKMLSKKRLDTISNMFLSFCKLRNNSNDLDIDDNIFDVVYRIIEQSTTKQPLNIKGIPNTGKSTFLGIQFLYLIFKFANGELSYIPTYINLDYLYLCENNIDEENMDDYIINENDGIRTIYSKVEKFFNNYLQEIETISKDCDMPICFIIDGLDQKKLFCDNNEYNIEKMIYNKIKEYCSELSPRNKRGKNPFYKRKSKCIFSFNNYNIQKVAENRLSEYFKGKESEYILYLNTMYIQSLGYKINRFDTVLDSYLQLFAKKEDRDKNKKIIKRNIVKYRQYCITLEFLNDYYEDILQIKDNEKSWNVLKKYVVSIEEKIQKLFYNISENDYILLEEAAFKLNKEGYTYEKINRNVKLEDMYLPFRYFVILKNNTDINNYILAKYFCKEFEKYANSDSDISDDSILLDFIPRDIFILIRLLLDDNSVIYQFINIHHEYLRKKYLYSNIVYLLGHLKNEKNVNTYNKYSRMIEKLIDSNTLIDKDDFFNLCNFRSRSLSKIYRNDFKITNKFLNKLLGDEDLRKFNRKYQLYYYGDIKNEVVITSIPFDYENYIYKGFDFSHTFYAISSKLEFNFNLNERYPLMELDLFTLCDLIYSRLQQVYINDTDNKYSLFYYSKYNCDQSNLAIDILVTVIKYLEKFLKSMRRYESPVRTYDCIYVYFMKAKNDFNKIVNELKKNKNLNIEEPYLFQAMYYEQILSIKDVERIGWHINENKVIDIQDYQDLEKRNKTIETISEHVFSSVYIALFFLPRTYKKEYGYCKDTIIQIILVHELGKIQTKDFTPNTNNHKDLENKEMQSLLSFLSLSSIDGFSNLYDLYSIFKENRKGVNVTDINYQIAMEINDIQREYQYYSLLSQEKIMFNQERKKQFIGDFERTYSSLGNEIRKKLILNNPTFRDYL